MNIEKGICYKLHRIVKLLGAYEAVINRRLNLSYFEAAAMIRIEANDGIFDINDLAAVSDTDVEKVSCLVNSLTEKKYIEKDENGHFCISEKGRTVYNAMQIFMTNVENKLTKGLSEEQIVNAHAVLALFFRNLRS